MTRKFSILDCSSVAGIYNDGNITISYHGGDLQVHIKNSNRENFAGSVKPSCEGYITFDNNEQEAFEFNEEDKEIIWSGERARDKWIKG